MKKRSKLLMLGTLIVLLPLLAACPKKYAVLISTNEVQFDDWAYHSEWWYDLVLQYQMLKDNGFQDSKIWVLYGSGTDFATIHPQYDATALFAAAITDWPVNRANVKKIFAELDAKMKSRDHLYVWWMGHGSGSGAGMCDLSMSISNTGEHVSDDELKAWMDQVTSYKKRTVNVMTCHAGGIVDEFANPAENTVTLASSTCVESSYDALLTCNGIKHADFNYTQPNALRQQNHCGGAVASDTSGNGRVSLAEAHAWNVVHVGTSTPQLGDPAGLAATTELAKKSP